MPRKLLRTRLEREPGFVYFLDADGDIARMRPTSSSARGKKVMRLNIPREPGYLYYIDRDGDVSRARLES